MRSFFAAAVFTLIFPWQISSFANIGVNEEQEVSRSTAAGTPQRLGLPFCEFSSSNFSIIHNADRAEAEKIAQLLELSYQRFQTAFKGLGFEMQNPEGKLMWLCFSDGEQFNRYAMAADGMDLSWLSGYYSSKTNAVAIIKPHTVAAWRGNRQGNTDKDAGVDILAITSVPGADKDAVKIIHEAAHQFAFNTGLQKWRVMYPLWFSEGLATSFESGRGFSSNDVRGRCLAEMYRQRRLIPLGKFITMTRLPADGRMHKDIYAQACGLFNFLCRHRNEQLRNYIVELYKLEPGRRSAEKLRSEFVSAFGTIDKLESSWLGFIESQSTAQP